MSEEVMERLLPEGIGPSAEVEKAALREMQMAFRERTTSAALALASAALVFACLPESAAWAVAGLRKGGVVLAAVFCVLSLVFWRWFLLTCRKLTALGLKREKGIRPRWSWECTGAFVGLAIVSTICAALGWTLRGFGAGVLPGLLVAIWLGRRHSQIPTYDTARDEERRVLSLKQDDDQDC